jgi:UDP-N-acetylglucosamine transferase subunit ALG13
LLERGCTVFIAAEGAAAHLLRAEFPTVVMLPLKGYRIRYAKSKLGLVLRMASQIPKIIGSIRYENAWLQETIQTHQIQLVISDNRYGLYSQQIPSVFITHQLTIKMPFQWLEKWVQRINYHYINRFTACWVPDLAGTENVAGLLSHPKKFPAIPVSYLGLLSRFTATENQSIEYDYCVLLSGPEPQRTLLENIVCAQISHIGGKKIIIRGKPGVDEEKTMDDNTTIVSHLNGYALAQVMQQSRYIISRSGYTSVMELLALQKKSILIPTPGQTEQEYLAELLPQQHWAFSVVQNQFNLTTAIAAAEQFDYALPRLENSNLEKVITNFLKQIS